MIITYICIFFIGASIGSFLNASSYRVDKGYKYPDIIKKRSHCEKCKKELTWKELFPILGYIYIQGRCTKCKEKINIYYPISELLLGTTFLLLYIYQISWYLWIPIPFLFILSYFDHIYMSIPKDIVHTLLPTTILIFLLFTFQPINLLLPLSISILFVLINVVKKSFGFGDILVLLSIGILLSYQQYLTLFWFAISLALLYSAYQILRKKIKVKNAKVPMIPFFSIAYVISIIYGIQIYEILLKYLGIW